MRNKINALLRAVKRIGKQELWSITRAFIPKSDWLFCGDYTIIIVCSTAWNLFIFLILLGGADSISVFALICRWRRQEPDYRL